MTGRVVLRVGERVLLPTGTGTVTRVDRSGYSIAHANGETQVNEWADLKAFTPVHADGERAVHRSLSPWWELLSEDARHVARLRLRAVQEVLTGYRDGRQELATEGEPFWPFGPTLTTSLAQRCEHMAAQLTRERANDPAFQRRVANGELKGGDYSATTVRNWVRAFEDRGLLGLVDQRHMRRSLGFETLDPEFREALLKVIETFDGDRSAVNNKEIIRRARVAMKNAGRTAYPQPLRSTGEFVSWMMKERGRTTRAQRSNAIRSTSGKAHFPALRPGQTVAIDATRADVLVWDPLHERPMSVEVLTAVDVASRVILACRVVPKSADAVDAALLLYDVMRPFHMIVDGTTMSDWRWAGAPESIDMAHLQITTERGPLAPTGTLQGVHRIPGVLPEAIRCDHGSIFISDHFRAVCNDFGIELLLSRGRRPSDNAHVERIHSTYDRFWQQLPGYKSNNVAGRGRKVEEEPLYTAAELEVLLRRWIALDYHQTWHEGIVLPGAPHARLTPVEYFDCLLEITGRIDLPVCGPYVFLPIRWGTVGHAGVEFTNLVYDSKRLDDFRNVRKGQFRPGDRAMPFFYDPHDVSRVWWMDPDTELVHEIPWRGIERLHAPMNDAVLGAAIKRIKARGGNLSLSKTSTERLILDEVTQLAFARSTTESRAMLSAAARRVEASQIDHSEAQAAQNARAATGAEGVTRTQQHLATANSGSAHDDEISMWIDAWPDLDSQAGDGG